MAESRERTDQEREAARLERERRRAQAAGAQLPVDPSPLETAGPPPPADDPAPDPDGWTTEGLDDAEVASGTRRVGWRERTAAARPRTARPPATPPGPRHPVRVRVLSVLALVLAAVLIWFCVELFQPFHGPGHGSVTVTIPAHSSARHVGDLLAREGVVASGFFFDLRAALAGDRGKLLAGTYHLRLDMSYSSALKVLTTPPPAAKTTGVAIIPGQTRSQIDALLRSQGIRGSYLAATRRSPLINLRAYGAPARTPTLEGFLFPDTYQLRVPISISSLVADQLREFKLKFGTVSMRHAASKHLTPYDVLIIASIVEKEAGTRHDFPLVASVIYNRLHDHIPLGMDSTTRYQFNDYARPLTQSQLNSPSPYNTRLHDGLPPTPISNPGMAAIAAAAHPTPTDYLYFVVKPGSCGQSVFESSYTKFLQDSARYQSARAQRGGRSPTKC